ncbi:hypothetical protein U6A24_11225 [Aquimarina gracilis]|uniref:Uncharacterized protein n=1 Tax=Aquimarina gracilis TaxID=874422 RepID=A0ABU5ZVY1_9FLAO|nr:hypothetical protein [Aquimarina gracilis]MEB3346037.1 hypothetical protein [Aquimarina gracilis]
MLELVIGMVISSLVVTMVYFIYDNLSRQVVEYSKQQDELMEYNMFQRLLSKDIQLSKELKVVDDEHVVFDNFNKEVHYFFQKERIIRKETSIDTFNIKTLSVDFKQSDKIDEKYQLIRLKTEILGANFEIFESKEVSIAKRMNDYLLNEH